jgi:ABC-type transport system substrate-binding protein
VRKAILGLLDVELLAAVGAGSDNSVTLDQALVRSPSDPGYVATAPAPLGRDRALQLFSQAGYQVERSAAESAVPPVPGATAQPDAARGRISRNGQQLTLVIGAAANDPTSVAVANTAADQLRSAGIAASVLALDPPVLYGAALAKNRVDAIVGWRSAGGDLATVLASRYGCPALEATPVPAAGTGTPAAPAPSAPPAPPDPQTPTSTTRSAQPNPLIRAPSNLTGICDRSIQPKIDGALAGTLNISDVIAAVEPKLWAMSAVLPIMQDTTIVAAGPTVQNVSLTGAIPIGIVGDAGRWVKTAP